MGLFNFRIVVVFATVAAVVSGVSSVGHTVHGSDEYDEYYTTENEDQVDTDVIHGTDYGQELGDDYADGSPYYDELEFDDEYNDDDDDGIDIQPTAVVPQQLQHGGGSSSNGLAGVDQGGMAKMGGRDLDLGFLEGIFGHGKKKRKKKKKKKFLFKKANFNIHGGTRLKGSFKSLKACMKACEKIGCLGGDYDTKTYSCFTHSTTICDDMTIAHGTIHFSAIPCDAELDVGTEVNAEIFVGMFAPHGVLVKKVKNILDCIKKCLNAGGGVASDPEREVILEEFQLCFGIDYDIITHKCYLHFHYWFTRPDDDRAGEIDNICVQRGRNAGNVRGVYDDTLWQRLSSVHIIFCE